MSLGLSSLVRFEGGVLALERAAVTFMCSCSASASEILLLLIADSVAVMMSTTGSCCGEMAKLSRLAKTSFSGSSPSGLECPCLWVSMSLSDRCLIDDR